MRKEIVRKFVDKDGFEREMRLHLSYEKYISITAECWGDVRFLFEEIKNVPYYVSRMIYEDYTIKDGFIYFREMLFGGCCHDKICEVFPEIEGFIPLHLVEYDEEKCVAFPFGRFDIPFDKLMTPDEQSEIVGVYERFRKRLGKQCREFIEFAESFSGDE